MAIVFLYLFFNLNVQPNPCVVIMTTEGDIVVELYEKQAPVTVMNFLKYVDSGRYANASFYRTVKTDNQLQPVKIQVIQGGLELKENIDTIAGIIHEHTLITGLSHTDGTVSMARNEPGTASTEFFICIGSQPQLDYGGLRNPDKQGFAAFGRVIKGMEVVNRIHQKPDKEQMIVEPVRIINIIRNND